MSDHAHGHSHGHGLSGGWDRWLSSTGLRFVLGALGVAAIAALVGVVVLWPDGSGRVAATESAESIGLATERIGATVITSENAPCSYSTPDVPQECRQLVLNILEGPDAGSVVALPEINLDIEKSIPTLEEGDEIVLGYARPTNTYFYDDIERSSPLLVLAVIFVVIVIAFGRLQGALALVAMASTVAILVGFVAPSVLDGNDPVLVALVAAILIAFISLFLSHGFTPTTAVALAGTLAALALTFVLSWLFFDMAQFSGFDGGESLLLSFLSQDLRISSLLLGGAVIGALGALDDVTVTQVSTVAELRRNNPEMSSTALISSGIRVGRDHIAATVNTLLLAYAGASLPIILLFSAFDQPFLTVANSEVIAVEIVRTLCGSIGLIAAVPLTTALAAYVVSTGDEPEEVAHGHNHDHDHKAPDTSIEQKPSWDDFSPEADGDLG